MVVAGIDYSNGNRLRTTQVFSVSNETKSCQNWNDYPLKVSSHFGDIVSGSPLMCGGENGFLETHLECYLMDIENKSWNFLTKMSTKRDGGKGDESCRIS